MELTGRRTRSFRIGHFFLFFFEKNVLIGENILRHYPVWVLSTAGCVAVCFVVVELRETVIVEHWLERPLPQCSNMRMSCLRFSLCHRW